MRALQVREPLCLTRTASTISTPKGARHHVLADAQQALGGDPALVQLVSAPGDPGLASVLPVGRLALGAVGAQRLAAEELRAEDGRPEPVLLDAQHVGIAFRSERFL